MADVLCTECGEVGPDKAGRCARCGSAQVLPSDAPLARKFVEERNARRTPPAPGDTAAKAQATGKVLGRALGRLFKK